MPFPSGWRTAGRQPELHKNKDLLLELGKGVGSSTVPRQPPAEPRCAGRRREVRLRWRRRAPGAEPPARSRGGAPQGSGAARGMPEVSVGLCSPLRETSYGQIPPAAGTATHAALLFPGTAARIPEPGRPTSHGTASPAPRLLRREKKEGAEPQPCTKQHRQQRPTPPPTKHRRPALVVPGMGTEPGLCCSQTSTLHPTTTPPPRQDPAMCTWKGKALNPTPQLGDNIQTPL